MWSLVERTLLLSPEPSHVDGIAVIACYHARCVYTDIFVLKVPSCELIVIQDTLRSWPVSVHARGAVRRSGGKK